MKKTKTLLLSAVLLASVSCGVAKRAAIPVDTGREIVTAHCSSCDIQALIKDLDIYPDKRDIIENTLFRSIDYSKYSYGELETFNLLAQDDYPAAIYFESLLIDRQSDIVNYLSDVSIEEVGTYYAKHRDEQSFLNPIIRDSYFTSLDSLDHKTLKTIHDSFQGTDLSRYIDDIYELSRSEIINNVTSEIDICYDEEAKILDAAEYNIRQNLEHYIQNGVAAIIEELSDKLDRGLYKRIFQREEKDNYSFDVYADKMVKEKLNAAYVSKYVNGYIQEFVSTSTSIRKDVLLEYLPDAEEHQEYYINPESVLNSGMSMKISNAEANNIQNIKNTGALLTGASFVLAFTPVGWVGLVADAADFLHGVSEDSKISAIMESMASTLYSNAADSINSYLNLTFGALRESKKNSELFIKERINEEF